MNIGCLYVEIEIEFMDETSVYDFVVAVDLLRKPIFFKMPSKDL